MPGWTARSFCAEGQISARNVFDRQAGRKTMDLILGVTGGSGCGKSSFCRELAAMGAHVIDADIVAREVVKLGSSALAEITKTFGEEYLLGSGELDRRRLGAAVFSDAEKLHKLNEITHKYIIEEISKQLLEIGSGLRVVDAAVLFESGLAELCGRTAYVLADEPTRCARIMRRDGLSREEARSRINAQQPDSFYLSHADDIIDNSGSEAALRETAKKYWKQLEKET